MTEYKNNRCINMISRKVLCDFNKPIVKENVAKLNNNLPQNFIIKYN